MNKADIIRRLTNTQLDDLERESLSQLLHYMMVEGVNTSGTSSSKHMGSIKRSSSSKRGSKKSTSSSKGKRTSSRG